MLWVALLPAQDLKEFEKKVTEFTLGNGLHFILVERHDAPVVSFYNYVGAGSVRDPAGQTGMARMMARMAFKGTETIGTQGWAGEKQALDDVDQAYARLEEERGKGPRADPGRLAMTETQWKLAVDKAKAFVVPNELQRTIQENGGTELTARTLPDSAVYGYSLPSNRIELWFLLESQRLMHPVFRDFYGERAAAVQDYHSNVESKALPRLQEALLALAFTAHPYRRPESGWPSDVANLKRSQAQAFFDTYYVAANMVMAIVDRKSVV